MRGSGERRQKREARLRKASVASALFKDPAFASAHAKSPQGAKGASDVRDVPDIEALLTQQTNTPPPKRPRGAGRADRSTPLLSPEQLQLAQDPITPTDALFLSDDALLEIDHIQPVISDPTPAADDFLSDQALLEIDLDLKEPHRGTGPTRASSPRLKVVGDVVRDPDQLRFVGQCQRTQQTLNVFVRDEWIDTNIVEGDTFRVILVTASSTFGEFPDQFDQLDVVIDAESHFLVTHPDTLINGTTVADSFGCTRRSVLAARHMSSRDSVPAAIGTVVHELFQSSLAHVATQGLSGLQSFLRSLIPELVMRKIEKLYGLELPEKEAILLVQGALPSMEEWMGLFFSAEGGDAWGKASKISSYKIADVLDVEETAWSPILGLKGKFDATVVLSSHATSVEKAVIELKTGKCGGSATTFHKAQVVLYNLLMSDVYETRVENGLLSYIPYNSASNQMSKQGMKSTSFSVQTVRAESVGLIVARNELARFLRNEDVPESDQLPPLLHDQPNMCRSCFSADLCMAQHKLLEGGSVETVRAGPGKDLFSEKTSLLTERHVDYYKSMRKVLRYEEANAMQFRKELWTVPAEEREASGRCLANLHLVKTRKGRGTRIAHSFSRRTGRSRGLSAGDYVLASLQSYEGAYPKYSITSGFVKGIDRSTLLVDLNSDLMEWAKNHGFPASKCVWRIDKEEIAASFNIARENLELLFQRDQVDGSKGFVDNLRKLVVDLEPPQFSMRSDIDMPSGLNESQKSAIRAAFGAKDYSLILGMPGTGKTATLAGLIATAVSRSMTVLLCSHTHSAVDNVLLRLQEQKVRGKAIGFLRLGRTDQVDERLRGYCLQGETKSSSLSSAPEPMTTESVRNRVAASPVIATTCLGIGSPVLARKAFDLVVVDEAGQIAQSICFGPLRMARKSFVLCGDHYQLSPLVRSTLAVDNGGDISLFRRLCEAHPSAIFSLSQQYRMCEDIMSLANDLVYKGQLRCANSSVATRKLPLTPEFVGNLAESVNLRQLVGTFFWVEKTVSASTSVAFIDTDGLIAREDEPDDRFKERHGGSARNEREAMVALTCVAGLVGAGAKLSDMCVISPYRAQLATLRKAKNTLFNGALGDLDCLTIDQAQGQDRECVVVSFVRSNETNNVGQLLQDWRRLNVAITRAKSKLVLVGSASTLRGGEFTKKLVDRATARQWVIPTRPGDGDLLPALPDPTSQLLASTVQYRSPKHLTTQNALGEHGLGGY